MFLTIDLGSERLDTEASDFPVAVGRTRSGKVVIGPAAEKSPVLWLGDNNGRIFAQPEQARRWLRFNDRPVESSVWLTHGDCLQIGKVYLFASLSDGRLTLSTKAPDAVETENELHDHDTLASETPSEFPTIEITEQNQQIETPTSLPRRPGRRIAFAALAVLGVLILGAGYVLIASPVRLAIEPDPDSISVSGDIPPIFLFERYLFLPGTYQVVAEKAGYERLSEQFIVKFGSESELYYPMRKLPGVLTIRSDPAGADVLINGKAVGRTPVERIELAAGIHEINIAAERYKPADHTVEIEGMEKRQTLEIRLQPGWGTLLVASVPDAASVMINKTLAGTTPYRGEIMEGHHKVVIRKEGWKSASFEVDVKASALTRLPLVRLKKLDGIIELKTQPSGALVTVNGEFRGRSPIRLEVESERAHDLRLTKPGYGNVTKTVSVKPGASRSIDLKLEAKYGTLFITARPSGARLKVDGKALGRAVRRLRLPATPHKIEISHPGYQTYVTTVTPQPGLASKLDIKLDAVGKIVDGKGAEKAKAKTGTALLPIVIRNPVRFKVGASRREAGRRSNEAQYTVELTRSFFIGPSEVSNEEFRRFRPNHNSGIEQGIDLNEPAQPVASVSWDDAARYLNWLSEQDGLPTAYREENGRMVGVDPMTTGYRLPTEAEWVYAARYEGGRRPLDKPLKYSWGNAMPPEIKTENFADESAASLFPLTVQGYSDGFMVAAPTGEFLANKAGIRSLGGNVSEWCHDYYDVYVMGTEKPLRDPLGPSRGQFHVVRGASWRHGSVTELRLSYRDFAEKPRNDLGFRIARYAN